ncbi:tetratricopeptide repeat protein [Paraburkholderia sediminicola]|uniref:tetratricopeptide repeat protein n=1 Tax=Paraburkholderia sediminicola TaxID=458836 RepID=UPI0038BB1499
MSIDRLFPLASSHHQAGQLDLAESHYRDAIGMDPDHWDARFGLAQVLIRLDRFDEAIGWLTQLLNSAGDQVAVYRQLGLAEACAGRRQRALDYFERVLEHDPNDPAILHIVANFQQALGRDAEADASYRRALKLKPLITVPAVVASPHFRVLFVFGPNAGNTPIEYLIEQARFESNVITLLLDMDYDVDRLRIYADVVVNLISDVDRGQAFLGPAQAFVDSVGRPVINPPQAIAETNRESVARRLAEVPGCSVPQTRRYPAAGLRELLSCASPPTLPFPLLVRPAGTHGGDDFERVEDRAQLLVFLNRHDAGSYYLTPFVDYRSTDGYFRKYRFVCVGDEILPYHLAIDDKWKVHHVTTSMANHTWMQAEEQAFLDDPWRVFGVAQRAALQSIRDAMGLAYFGIDCALDCDGAVVVFEANASMLVHGNNSQFPYKKEAVERIRQAFHALLERRALEAK